MNLQKKYEEYKAGSFSAHNFLREARMAYPNFVTNLNSIDDAVAILKNKNLVFEAKKKEVTHPNVGLDVLESAIRFELGEMDTNLNSCTTEEYVKARAKAEKNLAKQADFYVNLKAGIKKKDDSDKMKPVTSQNLTDEANKIQKLQEAILTVALKRMLTEEDK
tara:strand:+ start:15437 stop:15925 length:489 start_codon:yes stop_codon:yes gene_type:complete